MKDSDDILAIIVRDAAEVIPGKYIGRIINVDFDATVYSRTPYTRLQIDIGNQQKVYAMIPHNTRAHVIMKHVMPQLLWDYVRVEVKARHFEDRVFIEPTIFAFIGSTINGKVGRIQDEGQA